MRPARRAPAPRDGRARSSRPRRRQDVVMPEQVLRVGAPRPRTACRMQPSVMDRQPASAPLDHWATTVQAGCASGDDNPRSIDLLESFHWPLDLPFNVASGPGPLVERYRFPRIFAGRPAARPPALISSAHPRVWWPRFSEGTPGSRPPAPTGSWMWPKLQTASSGTTGSSGRVPAPRRRRNDRELRLAPRPGRSVHGP